MIKARPVAGDIEAGAAFLKELQPYVWRKYMDYAAIADVHSIKRQIHAHKGHGEIAVKGHNVKLGRGGIREIEFFVQTQQLIAGGRFPELRGRATVPMLGELAARGWITARGARCADRAILVPAPRRARHPDGRRRADAHAAGRRRRPRAHRPHAGLCRRRRPSRRLSRRRCMRSSATMRRCSRQRPSFRRASAIWSSPAMSRSGYAEDAARSLASSGRATSAASSAAGISAAIARRSRPRRASG